LFVVSLKRSRGSLSVGVRWAGRSPQRRGGRADRAGPGGADRGIVMGAAERLYRLHVPWMATATGRQWEAGLRR